MLFHGGKMPLPHILYQAEKTQYCSLKRVGVASSHDVEVSSLNKVAPFEHLIKKL